MSVVELATLRAKPGHGDEMERALPAALAVIAKATGSLGAAALRRVDPADEFVLRNVWVSPEDHQRFRETPGFAEYRATFSEHLDVVVGFAYYRELDATAG
jgi:quinol monooxygenase YgiN